MHELLDSLLVKLTFPVFAILIGIEVLASNYYHKKYYSFKDTLINIWMALVNLGLDLMLRGVALVVLAYAYSHFSFFEIKNVYIYWTVLLFAEDFLIYSLHLIDHMCRFFWAVHVTHHSSEKFNLTVSFRASVFQPFYRFLYFIPLTLIGFNPIDIIFIYAITQIWGMIIHTRYIGKLGMLEYILATPSHHRVHHGSNPKYLDKNMGMLFIIWDKLFGTFQKELDEEPVRYGLTTPLKTSNPFWLIFHEWRAIWDDLKKPVDFKTKIKYLFGPPGWSHDGSRKTSEQLRQEERFQQPG